MALEITATATAKITVKGTTVELPSIYSRLELGLPKNGKSMSVALYGYGSKVIYNANQGDTVKVEEIKSNYNLNVDVLAGEEQSLQLAHDKVKALLEAQGYTVAIVGLPVA